jgi:hypothetical protein
MVGATGDVFEVPDVFLPRQRVEILEVGTQPGSSLGAHGELPAEAVHVTVGHDDAALR